MKGRRALDTRFIDNGSIFIWFSCLNSLHCLSSFSHFSMDDNSKGTVDDGIYSSPYERYLL